MTRNRAVAAVAIALATAAPSAAAAITAVNTFGNSTGTERCMVGDGADRCTKGGSFRGAYSITRVFSEWTGRPLTRMDDHADRVWSAGQFGYIEVQGVARYLSGSGDSLAGIWADDGRFSAAELVAFPTGVGLLPADNRTVGMLVPGDKVSSDIVTGPVFEGRFLALPVGTAAFEFVYRPRYPDQSVAYYSSDPTSRGFANSAAGGSALDHMVTWHAGTRTDRFGHIAQVYLIAFERAHHDDDFQDAVYAVSIPTAVPEPSTWALLGAGALILGGLSARRRGLSAPG
jgi:hypothetical protein